jgi:aspartyl-tRNA(Asn)/glutamyl-tRNA(Gln) amidotransferase subunit A
MVEAKVAEQTCLEIAASVGSGHRTAESVVVETLARMEATASLGAFVHIDGARALADARAVDARVAAGERLPLAGVPVAVKDNLCTEGLETSCASKMLGGFVATYEATAVSRLRAAGAVVIGKTNMDEFAMGSSGETSVFGRALNPWDTERVPGGSSSGSAVAVSSRAVLASLGSDTGGSIRQPASFCGVVGFKPTYGRISRRGLVAFASSLDQIGPFTTDVADAALLFSVMAGQDGGDMTTSDAPVPALDELLNAPAPLRVGVPKEYLAEGLDPEIRARLDAALDALKAEGAEIVEVSLPHSKYAVATYYILASAEASSNLARFDGVRYGHRDTTATSLIDTYRRTRTFGFGAEVRRRIMLGTFVLSAGYYDAYYQRAQKVRSVFVREFEAAFRQCDVMLTPTAPTAAFKFGEHSEDPLTMYLADIYTIPANLAGLPAMSVPAGLTSDGLPVGVQLLAAPFAEKSLFGAALALERRLGKMEAPPAASGEKV